MNNFEKIKCFEDALDVVKATCMNKYPINFDIRDIIDTQYYEQKQTKIRIRKYKVIKIEQE